MVLNYEEKQDGATIVLRSLIHGIQKLTKKKKTIFVRHVMKHDKSVIKDVFRFFF